MPTGYTAGIIDGTTKTFEDYAKHCMRNFGACIHMRDSKFSDPYKPDTVSDYHPKEIQSLEKELKKLNSIPDGKLLNDYQIELRDQIQRNEKSVIEMQERKDRLIEFLNKAKAFKAPTIEHTGIRDFMIQQIEDTIDWDCNPRYINERVKNAQNAFKNIDVAKIRAEKKRDIEKDLAYHTEELQKETERVVGRNKWVSDFIASL